MSVAQEELLELTGRHLREAFGELVKDAPGEAAFFIPLGRLGVRVEIEAIGDQQALVEVYSWVAQRIVVDDGLTDFLVRRNAGLRFGALCVDGEGDIIFRHALFPDGAGKPVLRRLIEVMADTADTLDEEIRSRFGG